VVANPSSRRSIKTSKAKGSYGATWEKRACMIDRISNKILFERTQFAKLSKELYFITRELYFITRELYFITRELYFITRELYFITRELYSITREPYLRTREL
tara:strand:+ start:98 stop:403 length:306 start_codon:yes stop_codon:yes gene_type:complete